MSMQQMAAVITRFQATTDALAALGARLGMGEGEPPPDPLPRTTMRLRTIRDGGSVLDADGAAELLRNAGCQDVHPLARTWPVPIGFVTGQRA